MDKLTKDDFLKITKLAPTTFVKFKGIEIPCRELQKVLEDLIDGAEVAIANTPLMVFLRDAGLIEKETSTTWVEAYDNDDMDISDILYLLREIESIEPVKCLDQYCNTCGARFRCYTI